MDTESFELKVIDVVEETEDARSIAFEVPADAVGRFDHKPGQFLTVAVPSARTGVVARCYSLCSSPAEDGPPTITVKRTVDGYASNWIVENLRVGDTLRVLPPSGIFTPVDLDADLLLFAGGSGITPVMSITRTALSRGSGRVVLFYANRDERSIIFASALAELAAARPDRLLVVHWLESVQGLPTREKLKAFASQYATYDAFVCGPAPFMKAAVDALRELDFPRSRRHQERFVSLGGNPFAAEDAASRRQGPARLEVELDGETHTFDDWAPGTKLLEHLESKGIRAPFSCREGECSACACRVLAGEVTMLRNDVLDDGDIAQGIRLGCQSVPVSDTVSITYH